MVKKMIPSLLLLTLCCTGLALNAKFTVSKHYVEDKSKYYPISLGKLTIFEEG